MLTLKCIAILPRIIANIIVNKNTLIEWCWCVLRCVVLCDVIIQKIPHSQQPKFKKKKLFSIASRDVACCIYAQIYEQHSVQFCSETNEEVQFMYSKRTEFWVWDFFVKDILWLFPHFGLIYRWILTEALNSFSETLTPSSIKIVSALVFNSIHH